MTSEILSFELKSRFKKISTYVYFAVMLLCGFLAVFGASGIVKTFNVSAGDTSGKVFLNAPFIIFNVCISFSYLGMLIISAIMSSAAHRDFRYNAYPLFFTKPISKMQYLGGRFLGAFITLLFIFSGIGLGIFLASIIPIYEEHQIRSFWLVSYIQPYLVAVIPNIFLAGAIFFSVTVLSRKIMPVYLFAVIFFIGYLLGINLMVDMENRDLAGLIDPFGMLASSLTELDYWTISEKNTKLAPFEGVFMWNRVLWVCIGALWLWFGFHRFTFSQFAKERSSKKTSVPSEAIPETVGPIISHTRHTIPDSTLDFSRSAMAGLFLKKTLYEFWTVATNIYFIAIILAGMLFVAVNARYVGFIYGTEGYPVTYKVLNAVGGQFIIFTLIIITFFAGEMVWRERDRRMNQLYDALPQPDWIIYLSKLSAMFLVMVLILTTIMISGICIQTFKGFYHYELGLYLKELFGYTLIAYIELTILGMLFHVLVNNKYLGHFLMVLFYMSYIFLNEFGIEHNLFLFGEDPGHTYSDMNKYGPFALGYFSFHAYWALFVTMLGIISYLFWVRGYEYSWRERFKHAWRRFQPGLRIVTVLVLIAFFGMGGFIYYNTCVLNEFRTSFEEEALQAKYERQYKQYQEVPQPRITDVKVNVDIFPYERALNVAGTYTMKNKTGQPVETVYISMPADQIIINRIAFDRDYTPALSDKELLFYSYTLSNPLLPGEIVTLDFELEYQTRGFPNSNINTSIVHNGTFFNNRQFFPSIGYQDGYELTRERVRKRHDLEPKPRMAAVDDPVARLNTYISTDSDWLHFETVISTAPDQIAMAPGYLQREWVEKGRRFFHYKMDSPILNLYTFNSGKYEVKKDSWNDIAIEIYYHKDHEYNLDRMIHAVKKSLEYYSHSFSPYQHRQIRILEFPRYASFAQSLPNTIPYSESIGFLAKIKDDDVDYPFNITAHEMAHQWWAHQVIGANVQGATLMSEVLAQYSALMLSIREFEPKLIRKYVRHELDSYLRGRAGETERELPIVHNENQGYIHYGKGCVVMYALQDYIGEEQLNAALARYIEDYAYQGPPYTNSLEFIEYLRDATPDHLKYIIEDMFEKIVLYDNQVVKAHYRKTEGGRYEVTVSVKVRKFEADELGEHKEVACHDWIDVGVLDKDENMLHLEKVLMDSTEKTLVFHVDTKPAEAGIDPLYKLIDRKPDNNVMKVTT